LSKSAVVEAFVLNPMPAVIRFPGEIATVSPRITDAVFAAMTHALALVLEGPSYLIVVLLPGVVVVGNVCSPPSPPADPCNVFPRGIVSVLSIA
jgi:hypothetical protein